MPLSIVIPYAQAYLDRFSGDAGAMIDRDGLIADHPDWATSKESTPLLLLAERAHLSPSTLSKYLRGEGTIGFFDADALLTAVGAVGAWHSDPALWAWRGIIGGAS